MFYVSRGLFMLIKYIVMLLGIRYWIWNFYVKDVWVGGFDGL